MSVIERNNQTIPSLKTTSARGESPSARGSSDFISFMDTYSISSIGSKKELALKRLENEGLQNTEVYKILKKSDPTSKNIGLTLMAPTGFKPYDVLRNWLPFDSLYNLFSGKTDSCDENHVVKNVSKDEVKAAMLASPLVEKLSFAGHGSGHSVHCSDGSVTQNELDLLRKKYSGKGWEPLKLLDVKTCGDTAINTFGNGWVKDIYSYKGNSNPFQHMLSAGEERRFGIVA